MKWLTKLIRPLLLILVFALLPTSIQVGNFFVRAETMADPTIAMEHEMLRVSDSKQTWLFPRQAVRIPPEGRASQRFPALEKVGSAAYIVGDLKTGEIILKHNIDEVAYPASMTKIMTALTVIESPDFSLEKPVTFSQYAVSMPSPISAAAGFLAGETTTTENALYLMMVMSANDCARALAEAYGGTEAAFCEQMNAKAKQLGCKNTHLVDAAGFGGYDHHFTPHDLFLIIQQAMKHDLFRKLVSTQSYSSPPTEIHPYTGWLIVNNSNHLVMQGDCSLSSAYLHTFDGVKPGSTDIAGNCLAASAHTYDGKHLAAILFNGYHADSPGQFFSISILSRTLLEEAAKQSGSPTEDQAKQFLEANPSIAAKVDSYQSLCQTGALTMAEGGQAGTQQTGSGAAGQDSAAAASDAENGQAAQQSEAVNTAETQGSAGGSNEITMSKFLLIIILILWIVLSGMVLYLAVQHLKRQRRRY